MISLAKEAGLSASQVALKFDEKDLNEVLKQVGGYAQLQQSSVKYKIFSQTSFELAYSRCAQRGLIFWSECKFGMKF